MRKFGCLLIGLICFVSIVGVYAFNIIEKDDVHTPDYYESNESSGRPANNCWMKV